MPSISSMTNRGAMGAVDDQARAILAVVRSIPRGRVSTYGLLADRAGLPRRARLFGRVLSGLPADSAVPWHRVVAARGRIAFPARSRANRAQRAGLARGRVAAARRRRDGARK